MSIQIARSIATSALMSAQVQINVTSANIANADTAGYTRKIATQTATMTGGSATGTAITAVSSSVDKFLQRSVMDATTILGAATVADAYADRLQMLFGSTSGDDGTGESFAAEIAGLQSALSSLSGTPESTTLQSQVVDALETITIDLRETSAGIQDLRASADGAIVTAVDDVNEALKQIDALNDEITLAAARGEPTSDLEDQRATALSTITERMDVSYYVNGSGQMRIQTTSGQSLLDSVAHEISYQCASTVTADTVYSQTPPSGFAAISVGGVDITSGIHSGTIGALIDQRDAVLPAAQAELDALAMALIDELNAVYATGTPQPAPASLTGSAPVAASDSFSATGSVRLAVTDSGGTLVSYQDLDLTAYATVGDLVAALDGVAGLSASIDADGHVLIAADDPANGVSIGTLDSAVGSEGQGFADAFGLSRLLEGTGASDIAVAPALLASGPFATTSLPDDATLNVGDVVLNQGSASLVEALSSALTGDHDFDAAGKLGARTASFADYAAEIIGGAATAATRATSALASAESIQSALANSLSSQTGVNLDEETARLTDLQNTYEAAAQLLQTLNEMFDVLLQAVRSA